MVLNFGTSEGGIAEPVNEISFVRLARLAGRVLEYPSVSVTIDVLMKCSPCCRASGSDQEKWQR